MYAGEPGSSTGAGPYARGDSQEILLVLRGRITLWLGSGGSAGVHVQGPGDSVEYRTANEGDETAEALWAIAPPTTSS